MEDLRIFKTNGVEFGPRDMVQLIKNFEIENTPPQKLFVQLGPTESHIVDFNLTIFKFDEMEYYAGVSNSRWLGSDKLPNQIVTMMNDTISLKVKEMFRMAVTLIGVVGGLSKKRSNDDTLDLVKETLFHCNDVFFKGVDKSTMTLKTIHKEDGGDVGYETNIVLEVDPLTHLVNWRNKDQFKFNGGDVSYEKITDVFDEKVTGGVAYVERNDMLTTIIKVIRFFNSVYRPGEIRLCEKVLSKKLNLPNEFRVLVTDTHNWLNASVVADFIKLATKFREHSMTIKTNIELMMEEGDPKVFVLSVEEDDVVRDSRTGEYLPGRYQVDAVSMDDLVYRPVVELYMEQIMDLIHKPVIGEVRNSGIDDDEEA